MVKHAQLLKSLKCWSWQHAPEASMALQRNLGEPFLSIFFVWSHIGLLPPFPQVDFFFLWVLKLSRTWDHILSYNRKKFTSRNEINRQKTKLQPELLWNYVFLFSFEEFCCFPSNFLKISYRKPLTAKIWVRSGQFEEEESKDWIPSRQNIVLCKRRAFIALIVTTPFELYGERLTLVMSDRRSTDARTCSFLSSFPFTH